LATIAYVLLHANSYSGSFTCARARHNHETTVSPSTELE